MSQRRTGRRRTTRASTGAQPSDAPRATGSRGHAGDTTGTTDATTPRTAAPPGRRVYPLNFANPILRLYALSVDLSVLFLLFAILNLLTKGKFASTDAAAQDIFLFFGYFVILTGIFGQTPGKFVAGIVVVDSEGRTPGVAAAIPREMVGKFVATIVFGVGLAWVLFDPKRQGWHDKIAGTYVVRKGDAGVPGVLGRMFRRDGNARDA
jgi:uncharacterized RDD family membrane protein YckC